jgi:hypothetical protein
MISTATRVSVILILWLILTFSVNLVWGFNQIEAIQLLIKESAPQVEAFVRGLDKIGRVQLLFVILGFLYRRAIILVVKKTISAFAYILLETQWRRALEELLAKPGHYAAKGKIYVFDWHDVNQRTWIRLVFLNLYTAAALFSVTFFVIELLLFLVKGTLGLSPFWVEWQPVLIVTVSSFFFASVAQWFLLKGWNGICLLTPEKAKRSIKTRWFFLLRQMVKLRAARRVVTARVVRGRTAVFILLLTVLICIPN